MLCGQADLHYQPSYPTRSGLFRHCLQPIEFPWVPSAIRHKSLSTEVLKDAFAFKSGITASDFTYLLRRTATQRLSGSDKMPHPNFMRKASLFTDIFRNPSPPLIFGWHIWSQLIRWTLLWSLESPQIKPLHKLSMLSHVPIGILSFLLEIR